MDAQVLAQELLRDEELRLKPYRDTVGKLTIGVGRNLEDRGITRDEALELLEHDITRVAAELDAALPWWRTLSEPRQRVLANMAFNLGTQGLLEFQHTLGLVRAGKYSEASDAMLQSKWAHQVGPRASRLAVMMRDG
jgi:lysozyme